MSLALLERSGPLHVRLDESRAERASQRIRSIKLVCMAALAVCFWFSVPYQFPIPVDLDPAHAAANQAEAYQGSLSRQLAMPVIALIAVFLLWRVPPRSATQGKLRGTLASVVIMYCGWVAVSLLWSTQPEITGKRLIVFAVDVLFAYTLARCFEVIDLAEFGFAATAVVALIALYVDIPMEHRFAPLDPNYRFMGVMAANYMAMNLVVSIICAVTIAAVKPARMKWLLPFVVVELALLYLTRSRIGTLLGLLALSVLVWRLVRNRVRAESRALMALVILALAVPALVYAVGSRGAGAAQAAFMMGRTDSENTASLSNRAPLWAELMESVETRPVLGFGYAGFWTPARVERVSLDQGWPVPNAHDTYLDQWLSVGLIGALLYITMLWGACAVAWSRARRSQSAEGLFPALLLTWIAMTSLAESAPLDPYLPTMLAYACLAKMAMEPAELDISQAEEARV